ncbi:MAG TPA: ATP-binding protein [Nitrospiraceae bacterium]|nr:ATP-binding protein [Nitrospiraceae bacterium]
MGPAVESSVNSKQTTLQKTLTSALNELGLDAALIAIHTGDSGPLVAQVSRGLTPRDGQAILRALSLQEVTSKALEQSSRAEVGDSKVIRLRMITPGAKSLLAVPLQYQQRTYGMIVMGRKESATFAKKEKALLENTAEEITKSLEQASLFDHTLILSRSFVSQEPVAALPSRESYAAPLSHATPDMQQRVVELLQETMQTTPFDRAWVTAYDPIAGAVEVIGMLGGELKGEKKELKASQRLALETSASGWTVRHRKPRIDHDLASTQGRFQDHKHLYKDRYLSALVVPFFIRGQVGGTVTLASKASMQYSLPDVKTLEPLLAKLADLIQSAASASTAVPVSGTTGETPPDTVTPVASEPMIRKQERQAALGEFSAFLATEVREPLASIRAQLEDVTTPGILDFDSQTRVENAMRDLIRVESLLHEILDFAKPLELNRRICRITDVIENALRVVATDLDVNRIGVTKDSDPHISPVRCDDGKMQQVFLSIFKNALEAMAPGGHLHIEVSQPRASRHVQITVKNDGIPIPTEHVGKVFEPFFTTKRSGTGLGLASVKKIVEEHQGQISIASGPGQGTAVIIRLPGQQRGGPYRGRGRRPPRRR